VVLPCPAAPFGIGYALFERRFNVIGQAPIFLLCTLTRLREQFRVNSDGDSLFHAAMISNSRR
jgi:hypothetical protein